MINKRIKLLSGFLGVVTGFGSFPMCPVGAEGNQALYSQSSKNSQVPSKMRRAFNFCNKNKGDLAYGSVGLVLGVLCVRELYNNISTTYREGELGRESGMLYNALVYLSGSYGTQGGLFQEVSEYSDRSRNLIEKVWIGGEFDSPEKKTFAYLGKPLTDELKRLGVTVENIDTNSNRVLTSMINELDGYGVKNSLKCLKTLLVYDKIFKLWNYKEPDYDKKIEYFNPDMYDKIRDGVTQEISRNIYDTVCESIIERGGNFNGVAIYLHNRNYISNSSYNATNEFMDMMKRSNVDANNVIQNKSETVKNMVKVLISDGVESEELARLILQLLIINYESE